MTQDDDINKKGKLVFAKQHDIGGNTQMHVLVVSRSCQSQITHELGLVCGTGVDWDSFCREVCEMTMFDSSQKIGGEGKIVQID